MIVEIKKYISISESIDEILKNSPFKLKYIIEKTGISEPTFFRKMREKKFNADELLKIAEILEPEEKKLDDLLKSLDNADKDFDKGIFSNHETVMKKSQERFLKKYGNKVV
jgi:predicted DNA-binding transcriptional regulator AlpA